MSKTTNGLIVLIDKSLRWKRRTQRMNYYIIAANSGIFLINCLNMWANDNYSNYWILSVIWLQPAVVFFTSYFTVPRMRKSIHLDVRLRADALRLETAKSPDAKMFYAEQMLMSVQEFNKLYGIKEDVFVPWKKFQEEEQRRDGEGEEWKGD